MYSVLDFIQRVERSEGIILYGAGKRLQQFVDFFKDTKVLDKVILFVDRNM